MTNVSTLSPATAAGAANRPEPLALALTTARKAPATGGENAPATGPRAGDTIDFSNRARELGGRPAPAKAPDARPAAEAGPADELAKEPPIRHDLVDRIRAEIAAGTYGTDDQAEAAADRLLRKLGPIG
jgi:hypothetical protein